MAETKQDVSLADQQSAAATPGEPSSALTRPAERCADASGALTPVTPFSRLILWTIYNIQLQLTQKGKPKIEPTNSAENDEDVIKHSTAHDDTDIDIIWHNLYAPSDFSAFRKKSDGPIERILTDFARVVEAGIFEEVVSVSASKYLFAVTVVCTKGWDEVSECVFSVL